MQVNFELKHKDEDNVSPKTIMEDNVLALENLCRESLKNKNEVVLISPVKYEKPQNVYELSALIAEDLVKKFNSNNRVLRG